MSIAAASILGVVPCAGGSVRMGRAKALLELGGRSFVRRVVDALTAGGCVPVVVVIPEDPAIEAEARSTGAEILVNPEPGEGPVTSLRLALQAFGAEAVGAVFLPVDHPLVRGDTVRELVASARRERAVLALPVHDGERGHPAYFDASLFSPLCDPGLEGGARTVTHRHLADACLVPVHDVGVVTDIDTPEAYRAALGLASTDEGA